MIVAITILKNIKSVLAQMFPCKDKTIDMEKSTGTLVLANSSALERNIDAVQTYLKNTFTETKKEISEGLVHFKDGIADTISKTGAYIKNDIVLPVNNFIKDVSQMDLDFEAERNRNAEFCICLDGKMIPAEEVLKMPMEENY